MTSAANLPTAEKAALRRHYVTLRESIPSADRHKAEVAILETLFGLPAWTNAQLVCGYASLGSELDTFPIWKQAVLEDKTYALPVTVTGSREGRMIFRALTDYCPDDLSSGRYGIREPNDHFPALAPQEFSGALILIPGLAFDDDGYRLGYGGGYYDRFLADLRTADIPVTTVGLAFSPCRPATLPREIFDLPVDLIIDERRIISPHGSSKYL